MPESILTIKTKLVSLETLKKLIMYKCVTGIFESKHKEERAWIISFGESPDRVEYILFKSLPELVTELEWMGK